MMQALLRNPLADPYVLGISSGAAVGALAFCGAPGQPDVRGPIRKAVGPHSAPKFIDRITELVVFPRPVPQKGGAMIVSPGWSLLFEMYRAARSDAFALHARQRPHRVVDRPMQI